MAVTSNIICWKCGVIRTMGSHCIMCRHPRHARGNECCIYCGSNNTYDCVNCNTCGEKLHWWCNICKTINNVVCITCIECNYCMDVDNSDDDISDDNTDNMSDDNDFSIGFSRIINGINAILNERLNRAVTVINVAHEMNNDIDVDTQRVLNTSLDNYTVTKKPLNAQIYKRLINKKITNDNINYYDSACVICLSPYKNREYVLELPCKHYFHKRCISKHFKNMDNCPICRFDLNTV